MIATSEKLAQVLHSRGLLEMEWKARLGDYDDVKSDSPTPIIDLVSDLTTAGAHDLAERAKQGEWDATSGEWEAAEKEGKV